jgi:transposase-like protein
MKERKERRHFSAEFKKEILEKVAGGAISIAQLAREHDVPVGMICRWRREAREGEISRAVERAPRVEHSGVDPKYVRSLEEKLKTANEKLGELYIVVEGLKKVHDVRSTRNASSFVASGQNWDRSKGRVK